MAIKIYITGNFLVAEDPISKVQFFKVNVKGVHHKRNADDDFAFFQEGLYPNVTNGQPNFLQLGAQYGWEWNTRDLEQQSQTTFNFSEIVDGAGVPYLDADTFDQYLNDNLGAEKKNSEPVSVEIVQPVGGGVGIDAGGRTRVSQLTTLLDGKTLGEDDSELFENIGTGTATFATNNVDLSVTSGQYIIRQTKRFHPYFSGKSQVVEATCDNFQTQANVTKRIGYFSSNAVAPYNSNLDGFFLEDNGTDKTLYIYNNGTAKESIPFASMDNYDLVSSYDWSNFTVMMFDFLWLGGAVLRMWLKTDLGFVLVHTVNYSGTQTGTFMLSPNQPLRYEVRSTTGTGSLKYICSQIATEGTFAESGKTKSVYNASDIITSSTSTTYVMKGIKKRSTFRDTAVQIIEIGNVNTGYNEQGMLLLLRNPTLSGALTYANNGKIQEANGTGETVTANGDVICATPSGRVSSSNSMKENFLSFMASTIGNTMDEYVLAYRPATTNQSNRGIITIKEY